MSKYLKQLNVKLSTKLRVDLEDVASYEGVNKSELVRNWIRDKIREYRSSRAFQNWLRKREENQKEGKGKN